ncbi:MAG: copper resistance protein CopC [Phenylobacterium sp.]|jgi:methionine-rich copper-binding protein CopC|nr:copper resistance protein CopC [Phenylobacterium sp.]
MQTRLAILAAVTAPFLFAAAGAQAHAHVVTSSPAANATVASPKAIHLQYNEKLAPKFSGADLMTAAGKPVAVTVKAAGKAIDATPKAALAPGGYMVMWHAVADDGHRSKGQYNFTVK